MRAARGDDVEQIAMIAARRIGPFAGTRRLPSLPLRRT
jgi:hypothetical protein